MVNEIAKGIIVNVLSVFIIFCIIAIFLFLFIKYVIGSGWLLNIIDGIIDDTADKASSSLMKKLFGGG